MEDGGRVKRKDGWDGSLGELKGGGTSVEGAACFRFSVHGTQSHAPPNPCTHPPRSIQLTIESNASQKRQAATTNFLITNLLCSSIHSCSASFKDRNTFSRVLYLYGSPGPRPFTHLYILLWRHNSQNELVIKVVPRHFVRHTRK